MEKIQKGTSIRRAISSDISTIATFNAAMAKETEGIVLDRERLTQGVAGIFSSTERGFYLLAEVDDKPAGQLMVTFEWSDWRNGTFWWIQSVYVAPELRGKGLYKTLYQYLLTQAREAGNVCGIRLYVDKSNQAAQEVYRKLGMTLTHYDMYEVDFVLHR